MKQIKGLLLRQGKKEGKRREKESYTAGASPSEPTLPRNFRLKYSPISPTPGPRATSTPETDPLQQKARRQERSVVKIKAKDYNLNFDGEEVEKFIRKVERIAQIEGETDEDLEMEMAFWTTKPRISDAIETIPGYEEGNFMQLKKYLITKWGRVEPERRYRKYSLIKLFNDNQEDGDIGSI
ncbi:hypothetical protein O181_100731 [Austropuccinia psidii MF-1]|uniref:Uncharacterized protein n=1 Tax=Austropuccinia psidii MF-1 TaxID=1389203 RepID=A0A9Q3JFV0_9BASI|nr:hypothetical protein [Austropuccinia psidii MF-1]